MEPAACEADLLNRLEKMERSLTALAAENETLRAENKLLRAKVDKLVHRIFGRSSEQISTAQLELLLQFPEESPGKESASPCRGPAADTREASAGLRRQTRPAAERRPRLPEHLPV